MNNIAQRVGHVPRPDNLTHAACKQIRMGFRAPPKLKGRHRRIDPLGRIIRDHGENVVIAVRPVVAARAAAKEPDLHGVHLCSAELDQNFDLRGEGDVLGHLRFLPKHKAQLKPERTPDFGQDLSGGVGLPCLDRAQMRKAKTEMLGELGLGEAQSIAHVSDCAGELQVALHGAAMDFVASGASDIFRYGLDGSNILNIGDIIFHIL